MTGSSSNNTEQKQLEAARSFLHDIGGQESEMAGMSSTELKAFARGALGRRNLSAKLSELIKVQRLSTGFVLIPEVNFSVSLRPYNRVRRL